MYPNPNRRRPFAVILYHQRRLEASFQPTSYVTAGEIETNYQCPLVPLNYENYRFDRVYLFLIADTKENIEFAWSTDSAT